MSMKAGTEVKQMKLWHGTRKNNPEQIFSEDGFNIAFAQKKSAFGPGLYFAEKASYSLPLYAFKVE